MWKQHDLVMLPTNEKANALWWSGQKLYTKSPEDPSRGELFNLYILSDQNIQEGDWYYQYNPFGSVIDKCDDKSPFVGKSAMYIWENGGKKIIATTDKSLEGEGDAAIINLAFGDIIPQLPQSFIEYFVEEYNKGNVITEVLVEYEISNKEQSLYGEHAKGEIKINPKDNTITIKKVKDSWTTKEWIDKIRGNEDIIAYYGIDKWIEENLR